MFRLPHRTPPPVAVDDSYSTDMDAPLSISAPGVLDNDTDADGDPLTAAVVDNPANGSVSLNTDGSFCANDAPAEETTPAPAEAYEFQLEGEGSLMVTRDDGLCAGVDPATGQFIAEIPGAEQVEITTDDGRNIPNVIHIPHVAGRTYALRIADVKNEYGNQSATANLNILGDGYVTRLKGLKIDSPADPETATPGNNDVVGVTFDGDNHSLGFTSSALDSDTPALAMAVSQNGAPDYTFEVGGAQMPSGRSLTVAIDSATGKLTVQNDDPVANSYRLDVECINLDGTKTTYHSDAVSDGTDAALMLTLAQAGPAAHRLLPKTRRTMHPWRQTTAMQPLKPCSPWPPLACWLTTPMQTATP